MKRFLLLFCLISFSLSAHEYKAVIYDCGEVLMNLDRTVVSNFVQGQFNLSDVQTKELMKEWKSVYDDQVKDDEFWKQKAQQFGKDPIAWKQEFDGQVIKSIKLIPGMMEYAKELQNRGFIVGMLSNATAYQAHVVGQVVDFNFFNPALISSVIGYDKPDPKAFQVLIDTLQIPAHQIIFIDDKPENVEAASSLQIQAIQFLSLDHLKQTLEEILK